MTEHFTDEQMRALKKIRGDWGDVNPVMRIEPDRKKVPKKIKHKKKFWDEAQDAEEVYNSQE